MVSMKANISTKQTSETWKLDIHHKNDSAQKIKDFHDIKKAVLQVNQSNHRKQHSIDSSQSLTSTYACFEALFFFPRMFISSLFM